MANAGSLAVGIKSGKRWKSGCWDKEWQTLAVWLVAGFQARSKDREILEEGGGAGPSTLPRRDHE